MTPAPIYLDHAATTPLDPRVREAAAPYLDEVFGNPSSPHRFGRAARAGVEQARRFVAQALGADPAQVLFTSGGTEANNLAVVGAALAARERGGPFRVAVSAVEHKSVLAAGHMVEALGGELVSLVVDHDGRVDPATLDAALERGVAVASVMAINNETGVIQDIVTLGERCQAAGVPFHCDAVQAFGKIPIAFAEWPCAMLTVSGHKIGAPKGVGALVVRDRALLRPLIRGGSQQFGMRPGTENVPGIVGFGRAAELAAAERAERAERLAALRDEFERQLTARLPDVVIHGRGAARGPNIANFSIPGTDSEAMLMQLDLAGVACSSGSACTTGTVEPSHVLTAMGVSRELGIAALRVSLGGGTRAEDLARAVEALAQATRRVRRLAGVLGRG